MNDSEEEGAFQSADEGEGGGGGGRGPAAAPSPARAPSEDPAGGSRPVGDHRRPIGPLPNTVRLPTGMSVESPTGEGTGVDRESVPAPGHGRTSSGGVPPPRPPPPALEKVVGAEKNKPAPASGGGAWGSWGNWGASLINTASTSVSSSVSNFTSHVGEGFQTVLDTVGSSLGAPDAEQLVKGEKPTDAAPTEGQPVVPIGQQPTPAEASPAVIPTTDANMQSPASEKAESIRSGASRQNDAQPGVEGPPPEQTKAEGGGGGSTGWGGMMSGWGGISGITSMVKDTGALLVSGGKEFVSEGIGMVQDTGKSLRSGGEKVIGGGLTVLETIGKKTYDVIAEGDHGLKETLRNKPNLSQMLRDAKKKAEGQSQADAEFEEVRKAHFGMLFDDYNGLVHLEALEAVSNQCESKVQNMLMVLGGDALDASKHELIIIKEIFQIEEFSDEEAEEPQADEDHEFEQLTTEHVGNLGLSVTATRLIEAHHKSRLWLKDCADEQSQGVRINSKACQSLAMYDGFTKRNIAQEIHQMAIQSLAELTAVSVEQFHKVAQQLLLRQEGAYAVFKSKATCLFNLVRVISKEVDIVAVQFTQRLNKAAEDAEEPDSVNPFITNVYLEATNSKTYIQDAFQLLLPVLQQAALQANTES